MYVILCYDVAVKRNTRVKKIVRQYLRPVQKSVCEGFITESKLKQLCTRLKKAIDPEEDAVLIYKTNVGSDFEKLSIGQTLDNSEAFIL